MYNYVLSFKFEGTGNAHAERFAKAAASLLKKLKEESYEGHIESLQVAIVQVEDKVAE